MGKAQPPAGIPGQVLQQLFMTPLGISSYRLASDLKVPPIAISEILRGKRAISPAMALRLGAYFGVEGYFWLSIQAAYDLQQAAAKNPPTEVARCLALGDRSLVLQEAKTPACRRWQVLMVGRPGSPPAAAGSSKVGGPAAKMPSGKTQSG